VSPKPRPVKLSRSRAKEILRIAADDSSLVFLTVHAQKRMRERNITLTEILRILRSGRIIDGPAENLIKGNWECTVNGFSAGKNLQVSVAIERDEKNIIVVTVYYLG